MTDSLKFGPEWLRNLAGDGCNSGGGGASLTTPRYQLAEHRYGREEMLALFDRNYKPPEPLTSFSGLYVPKTQLPLALIQMTEDETRLWNGGVSASTGRGRGGSVDRGGRSRSGRTYRGAGFDDLGDSPRNESQPFPARTRAFDRPPADRSWSERNGAVDSVEWNGSTSPRKELSRGASGGSLMESNWRRHRGGGDDEEGWRINSRENRGLGKPSWRDADKDRADGDDDKRGERWDHKGGNRAFDPHPPPLRRNRSNHHDNHDNLPEWATENPSESGGSFDASGAFHGMYSDDDEEHPADRSHPERKRGSRVRRVSEGNAPHSKNGVKSSPASGGNSRSSKTERSLNGERPKSLHSSESKDQYTSAEKESRRSLSPISSPPVPSSPASKKTSATTNDAGSGSGGGGSKATASASESRKKEKASKQEKQQKEQAQTNASKAKSKPESPKKVAEPKTKAESQPPAFSEVPDESDPEQQASNMIEMAKREQEIYRRLQEVFQMKQDLQQQSPQQQKQLQHQSSQPVPTSADSSIIEGPMEDKQRSTEADHLNRMEEEVAKLIDGAGLGDEKPSMSVPPPGSAASSSVVVNQSVIDPAVATVMQSTTIVQEKWYYRDPQGEVQGPFLANEMAEWHKQGYFAPNLLVRRTCDERYTTLGDLVNLCGTVPFKPGTNFAPLKLSDTILPGMPSSLPTGLPVTSALPKPGNQLDPLMIYQIEQYRMLQNQHMFLKQLRASAINKLSQTEQWSNLTPVEQNQLVLQYVRSIDPELADLPPLQPPVIPSTFIPTIPPPAPPSNSVLQLFPQLHQTAKTQAEVQHVALQNSHPVNTQPMQNSPIDPIQQLMQQMSGMRNLPPMPQAPIAPSPPQPQSQPQSQLQDDNPIKQWMRQFSVQAQQQRPQPQPQPPVESVWQQPVLNPNTFNRVQDWVSQVRGVHPIQPGQMPGGKSLLDFYKEKMMTEQQILEEQRQKEVEEEQRKQKEIELQRMQQARAKQEAEVEQQRKHDELRMKQERAKRQQEEELARLKAEEVAKREEAERKKREEEKKRREEEKRRQEEEQRKQEEKRRKEEERKREEKRKQDEEANKKKQEEEKKKREELKRQEEKLRKEEEKRKKLEEEQRKQEEERLRKEEETRKKAEAEEQARKAEQRRREAEALRKLQERSKAPWAQAPPAPPPSAQASLTEIQRLEREKKAEELRLQQLLQQQQLAQQKAAEAAQEALADSAKRLQFKWAEKTAPVNNVSRVQSLAQIQQEEQERIAKIKQEKERQEKEKASHKEITVTNLQNVSIWGAASQSLTWSSTSNSGNQMYGSGGGGFWDEPAPKVNAPAPKATTPKPAIKQQPTVAKSPAQQQQQQQQPQQQQQQQQQQQLQQQQNNKAAKSKNKKDEELVKKLFEQNTAKTDDFTQWCNKALTGLQVSVDIPTFIGFLRDIEAAYEVKEYVRMYLGDGKQCSEFAKQFLEKRSKWRSAQRPQTQADDLCKPAPAINPNTSTEFQEVKSKSKKPKKGKMFKVDSQMLGFSVMSAPDRINVGDRDYAEGV